ncbi:MAG: ABC transporter substrate-binding protein [Pseudomonadota bacterium]
MSGFYRIWSRFLLWVMLFLLLCLGFPPCLDAREKGDEKGLKVALLPILDSLPFYVAESEGYFAGSGMEILAVPVASGLARDQLMQSGEIDGMLNEMATTANFNRLKVQVRILGMARKATGHQPLFRILAAPGGGPASPSDLSGIPIGISKNTIIEYVTDRVLIREGLKPEQIVKKSVPVIPERYQLLMQGRIKAATLPDPLALSAMAAGATEVISDARYPQYSVSVLSFSLEAMKKRPEAIRFFLRAWDRACEKINAAPDAYRDLLLKKIRVPKNVQKGYPVPSFPRKEVPAPGQWEDVMDWMIAKGLLQEPLPYKESITGDFLP